MEGLHHFVRMPALPIGVHSDDTTLPDEALQLVFDLHCCECWVGITGHDIPKNKSKAECAGHIDGVVIEFPIGGAKQRRVMPVIGLEQANRSENFLFLIIR